MKIQKIVRWVDPEKDGEFAPAEMDGHPDTNTEYRLIFESPEEKQVVELLESLNDTSDQTALNTYFASLVVALTELRGRKLRQITDSQIQS